MQPGEGVMGIPREKAVGSSPLSTRQAECASHYSDGGLCSALLLLCSLWLDRAEGQRPPPSPPTPSVWMWLLSLAWVGSGVRGGGPGQIPEGLLSGSSQQKGHEV